VSITTKSANARLRRWPGRIDELGGLVVIQPAAFGACNRQMRWQFEIKVVPAAEAPFSM
jgi:hypothetical protein